MANHHEAPEIIMFVRHGEKPGDGSPPHGVDHHGEKDEHSLSVQGWTRAGALASLFAHVQNRGLPLAAGEGMWQPPGIGKAK